MKLPLRIRLSSKALSLPVFYVRDGMTMADEKYMMYKRMALLV